MSALHVYRWLNKNQMTMRNVGTPRNHAIPYFICFLLSESGIMAYGNFVSNVIARHGKSDMRLPLI